MNTEIGAADESRLADDLLHGISSIANFLGESERRTYYLAENRLIPLGKVGAIWTGSKSALREHYKRITQGEVEAQPRRHPQPEPHRRSTPLPRPRQPRRAAAELASA
jgi:hypothetical protein